MAGLEEALERLVTDRGFLEQLKADPSSALHGYDLDDAQRALLASQIDEVAGQSRVEQRTSKAGLAGLLAEAPLGHTGEDRLTENVTLNFAKMPSGYGDELDDDLDQFTTGDPNGSVEYDPQDADEAARKGDKGGFVPALGITGATDTAEVESDIITEPLVVKGTLPGADEAEIGKSGVDVSITGFGKYDQPPEPPDAQNSLVQEGETGDTAEVESDIDFSDEPLVIKPLPHPPGNPGEPYPGPNPW